MSGYIFKVVVGAVTLILAGAACCLAFDPARKASEDGNQRLILAVMRNNERHVQSAQSELGKNPDKWRATYRLASSLYSKRVTRIRLATKGDEVRRPAGAMPGDDQLVKLLDRAMALAATPGERAFTEYLFRQFYGSS